MKRYQHRRNAMSYVLVLGTVMALTVISLSAITAMRIRWRSTKNSSDVIQTRLFAQSAVDLGMLEIEKNPNWRQQKTNGIWATNIPIGNGFYNLSVVDPVDADLNNDEMDFVLMTGTGWLNQARYKLQITLQPQPVPISSLASGLHAGNDIVMNTATITSDSVLSANDTITANNAIINADAEAVNNISGSSYNGTNTVTITSKIMPRLGVFDYYLTAGTTIAYNDLTTGATSKVIENVVLSPANNPYGLKLLNTEGIYVIDCAGADVKITNSRIVGTLLLINPGANSAVENAIQWEPAVANLPALLVDGSMILSYDNIALAELGAPDNINYNPINTPYNDVEDTDTLDTYPSEINGMIYISDNVTVYNNITVNGTLLVGNTATLEDPGLNMANVNIVYDDIYFQNPPPGFTDTPNMTIAQGSWRQIVD